MSKSRPFHPIRDILEKFIKGHKWDAKWNQYSFLSQWSHIVGTEIAKYATPKVWRGNTLFVEVANSSWLQELKMMEIEILEKIRQNSPQIKIDKIRWVLR